MRPFWIDIFTNKYQSDVIFPPQLDLWKSFEPWEKELWGEYTMRKFQMLLETNTTLSPWTVVRSDNKKKARINCMKYILSMIDYEGKIPDDELIPDSKILISGIDELKLMESNLSKPHKLPG